MPQVSRAHSYPFLKPLNEGKDEVTVEEPSIKWEHNPVPTEEITPKANAPQLELNRSEL